MKTKGSFKKGCIPWNKGLTKETDKRIMEHSEKLKGEIVIDKITRF